MYAVLNGHLDIAQLLLSHDADFNVKKEVMHNPVCLTYSVLTPLP